MTICFEKNCSFGLLRISFVSVYQFCMCVFPSVLVLRVGCGIRLYNFLIIAILVTLAIFCTNNVITQSACLVSYPVIV